MDYAEACKEATTFQGLDPVIAALAKEGVDVVVEQTGGFTMVATVYLTDDHSARLGITEERDSRYLLCAYPEPDSDGEIVYDDLSLAQLVHTVINIV